MRIARRINRIVELMAVISAILLIFGTVLGFAQDVTPTQPAGTPEITPAGTIEVTETPGTIAVPGVAVPTVTVPTVVVPTVTVPTVTIPTVTIPTVTIPTVVIPTITVPTITVPGIPPVVVPEFPSVVLPIAAVMGLVMLLLYRRRDK